MGAGLGSEQTHPQGSTAIGPVGQFGSDTGRGAEAPAGRTRIGW